MMHKSALEGALEGVLVVIRDCIVNLSCVCGVTSSLPPPNRGRAMFRSSLICP